MSDQQRVSATECDRTGQGHRSHWGPAKSTPPSSYRPCRISGIDAAGWLNLECEGASYRFWNHDPVLLQELVDSYSESLVALSSGSSSHLLKFTNEDGWSPLLTLGTSESACTSRKNETPPSAATDGPDRATDEDDDEPEDEEELDTDDPIAIALYLEDFEPTFEVGVDEYWASAWEIDEQWFITVRGPEGFWSETSYLGYETEAYAREEIDRLIEENRS